MTDLRRTPGSELDSRFGIFAPNEAGTEFTGDGYSAPGDGGSGSGGGVISPPVPVLPPGGEGPTDQPPQTMPAFSGLVSRPLWISVENPAAGTDWIYTHEYEIPATVIACYYRFVTSAAVGGRTMKLSARNLSDNRIYGMFLNVSQAASISREYTHNTDFPLGAGTHSWSGTLGLIVASIAPIVLRPYFVLRSDLASDASILAGDRFSNISLLLRFDSRP